MPILHSAIINYVWRSSVVGAESVETLDKFDVKDVIVFDFEQNDKMGFFAYKYIDMAWLNYGWEGGYILGQINGFGKIAVHQLGFRSQQCQVRKFVNVMSCTVCHSPHSNIYFLDKSMGIMVCSECAAASFSKDNFNKFLCQYDGQTYLKHLCKKYDIVDLIPYEWEGEKDGHRRIY